MKLEEQIIELAKQTSVTIDRLDIGITLSIAMSEAEQDDLEAMLHYLSKDGTPSYVLSQVMHDLNGCKARHLKHPSGICFLPRSHNFAITTCPNDDISCN